MEVQNIVREIKGLVFDIRRFSTHDGPGLRTTVFTKGCALRCKWCQNPEGLDMIRNLCYFKNKCIGCGICVNACPEKAISLKDMSISIDRKICKKCGMCVEVCPANALAFDSKEMTVEKVIEEVLKDREFYDSIGGVTLSGGDPFSQKEFTLKILKECKKQGINTAIETCLYVDKKTLELFLPYIDFLIADFKVFDAKLHKLYTGVDNTIIKENFTYLFKKYFNKSDLDILVRIPLIPGFTATEENFKEIAGFLYNLSPEVRVEILNYNPLAQNKYILMKKEFIYDENPKKYTKEEMEKYNSFLVNEGIKNIIKV